MKHYLVVGIILLGLAIGLLWYGAGRVAHNLQTEMQENASLRRQVVELGETNKAYGELFNCFTLKSELGLIEEEGATP